MNALVETEITQLSTQVFAIESQEDLIKINAVLKGIKGLKKKIEDELDPEIKKANDAHKGLTALKNKYIKPLRDMEDRINTELKIWTTKKENEAKALQDKVNSELAESAAKNAESEWEKEVAKESAVTVDIKACQETVAPKIEGQYRRSNWKAKCMDIEEVPLKYLMLNESLLNSCAKDEEMRKQGIPGIEFYDDFTIVTKG